MIENPGRQKPPRFIKPPCAAQGWGRVIRVLGKHIQVQWGLILRKIRQPVCSDCCPSRCLVVLGQSFAETLLATRSGTCTLVQLAIPFTLALQHPKMSTGNKRQKWDISSSGGSFDLHIYIDAIRVPKGVPNEFKGRNKIAAGFESVLFWWSTVNKNVAWINYIYYNQQRFVNYARDAIKGIAEQLVSTSKMA
jgi:hypothetical protein